MELIRDCLDKQLIDRNGRKMGKADGLVMSLEKGKQPRVAFIEVGAITASRRLHPRLAKLVARLSKSFGVDRSDPYRIPWSKVVVSGIDVTINVDAEETPALDWEKWLRKKVIGKIPGA
jgi:sporulation protein YlmC with PRC-barrel domain